MAACGGSDEVTLVETTTEQGITVSLPSDFTYDSDDANGSLVTNLEACIESIQISE